MDPLLETLVNRDKPEYTKSVVDTPSGPTVIPSKVQHLPPAFQRWAVSQKMQAAYRNNWIPNPILMRILGHKQ